MTEQGGSTAMSLDEFLGHDTRGGGGGDTNFLRWNKRQPPAVNTWLHTRAPIVALWQHGWPRVVDRKDQQTGQEFQVVWGGSWNCWESEAVLKKQYFRDKDTGRRKTPPQICPHCILIDTIYQLVDSGRLSWVAPIFRFDVGDPQTVRVLHAGGLYNAYGGKKDLTPEELQELKQAQIYRKEAWRENAMAKCNYVFRVVDNDDPGEGIQVTTETTGLGDKVKATIRDRIQSQGAEAGNPMRSPYCIRWEHHPNEQQFDRKYRVVAMDRIQLTEQVRQLICDDNPPDIAHLTRPGNVATLRSVMEQRYVGPQGMVDWDAIFGPAEAAVQAASPEDDEATSFDYGYNEQPPGGSNQAQEPAPAQGGYPSSQGRGAQQGQPSPASAAGSPMAAAVQGAAAPQVCLCDDCDAEMLETDSACPNCGKVYVEEPPPPRRRRSQAAAQPQGGEPARQRPSQAQQQGRGQDSGNPEWGVGPDEAKDGAPF